MNTMNRGIAYTVCVTALDTSKVYTATLRNAATKTSVSVAGFFVGDKAYFYFAPEVTATMQVGVYQLNVYDTTTKKEQSKSLTINDWITAATNKGWIINS